MGASLTMIDRHYGHLARDGREHATTLLDSLAAGPAVECGWSLAWTVSDGTNEEGGERVARTHRQRG
jgi:hypothetical protein